MVAMLIIFLALMLGIATGVTGNSFLIMLAFLTSVAALTLPIVFLRMGMPWQGYFYLASPALSCLAGYLAGRFLFRLP